MAPVTSAHISHPSRDWGAVLALPLPAPSVASVSGMGESLDLVSLPPGRGDTLSASQNGAVIHGKSVIILHDHTLHRLLWCAPIGLEDSNVCLKPIKDCEVHAHSDPGSQNHMSAGIYFRDPPRENFMYCALVGDVGLWESHRDLVGAFFSSSLSEWTLAL